MTPRLLRLVATAMLLALVLGLSPAQSVAKGKPKPPDKYVPPVGVRFNNPYGPIESERANFRHLLRSINSTAKGEKIRIASWNVRSGILADALIDAHQRGVSVRILMDRVNAYYGTRNRDVTRLVAAFKKGNSSRRPSRKSWLRKCISACRGRSGIAHSKFYLFSKIRNKEDIVIFGSNNLTELAATIQWNDLFTIVGKESVYKEFNGVFKEMAKDRPAPGGGYRAYDHGGYRLFFYPYTGPVAEKSGDPDLNRLNQVKCQGATGGTGNNGRTVIRIAQTAMYGDRGILLAKKLASLRRAGCDIRVVYAMFGTEVLKILRGAGIGVTHLAWDSNNDCVYDRYIHMKSMAISGNYGGRTDATVTVNGSANLTQVALASDEIVAEFRSPRINRRYIDWTNFLFNNRPAGWTDDNEPCVAVEERAGGRAVTTTPRKAHRVGIDPYSIIKLEN
jgi:hypothetical protein